MEVVPTGDGDDDGVVWFRCPQCQGFLPKLGGALAGDDEPEKTAPAAEDAAPASAPAPDEPPEDMPWDSPADMIASQSAPASPDADPLAADAVAGVPVEEAAAGARGKAGKKAADEPPPEPIGEYASLLAEQDPSTAEPYRPWQTYEVGQCVHHLAWDDCGVVVAKEDLPGGRHVIKCYFSEAGVVRLIEQAPR